MDSTTIALHILLEILSGICGGFFIGLLGFPLKKVSLMKKTIYLLSFTAGIVLFFDYVIGYPEAKYLAVIFFGYSNHRAWGHN